MENEPGIRSKTFYNLRYSLKLIDSRAIDFTLLMQKIQLKLIKKTIGSSELSVENEIGHRSKIILKADGICLCSNRLGIDINGRNPNLGITVVIGNFYCDAIETIKHFSL